jgi:hypothetical protein
LTNEEIGIALALLVVVITGVILLRFLRKRPNPEEIERRRREHINLHGKIGDCEILDLDGAVLHFTYGVAGVVYTAAQDVSGFVQSFPEDRMVLIGPALLKYDPRNPANSIVICEAWSGLPKRH